MSKIQILLLSIFISAASIIVYQNYSPQSSQPKNQTESQLQPQKIRSLQQQMLSQTQSDRDLAHNGESFWDQKTDYADNFAVDGRKVTKKTQYQTWFQITGLNALPTRSSTTFRLLSYGNKLSSVAVFGIITASRKQQRFSGDWGQSQVQSVGYGSWPEPKEGFINIDGQRKANHDSSLYFDEKGLIQIDVDLSVPKITFINKRNNISRTFNLADHFKQQPVYFFVDMWKKGTSVQIVQ